jgi:hypothetical protein
MEADFIIKCTVEKSTVKIRIVLNLRTASFCQQGSVLTLNFLSRTFYLSTDDKELYYEVSCLLKSV